MNVVKVAEGAFFVPSYSVQTLTTNYDPTTSQQVLQAVGDDQEPVDEQSFESLDSVE